MKRNEFFLIILPFLIFLVAVGYYEIQTGLILDKATMSALGVFFILRLFVRAKSWWTYPLGSFLSLVLFMAIAIILNEFVGFYLFGGGALKLIAVMGMVLGIGQGMLAGLFLLGLMGVAHLTLSRFFGIELMPSSPLIFFSTAFSCVGMRSVVKMKSKTEKVTNARMADVIIKPKTTKTAQFKPANTRFFKTGLILFSSGVIINTLFMNLGIGGILRELSRGATLVGFFLIILGGLYALIARPKTT